jgi:citrate lyase subunit beta/citryl-CoA lyase
MELKTVPARSYLFVPGDRPERFSKALASGADAVIVDLEDAVSHERKEAARQSVAEWLSIEHPVHLRVNGPDTSWFHADLELCRHPGVLAIVLPKTQEITELKILREIGGEKPLLPMIESARGFANMNALAAQPGVERLIFGTCDFRLDLGIEGDGEELLYFRSQLVLTSKLAGLQAPVDGVTTEINDASRVRSDSMAARRLGFGGKLCIHPNQLAVVNECFGPSAEDIAWAERVMEASRAAAGGAIALDGKMIDRPIVRKAEAVLRASRRGQKRS